MKGKGKECSRGAGDYREREGSGKEGCIGGRDGKNSVGDLGNNFGNEEEIAK